MILCVGANPALDHTLVVSGFRAGEVSRAQSSLSAAGGKGLNVARAAQILGGQTWSAGFLAGYTGKRIEALAKAEGIEGSWAWVSGDTRTCTIIADPAAGEATVVNENGPQVDTDNWNDLASIILQAASRATDVCFSGSLPPGAPLDGFRDLLFAVRDLGKRVWVDTSGAPLKTALTISGIVIKINGEEAGAILGRSVNTPHEALEAALEFQHTGLAGVVITLGKDGAIMTHPTGHWLAQPPSIKVVDAVGSGDSFLAGLVTAWAAGQSPEVALKHAVAAGAANATTVGGGDFPKSVFADILNRTTSQTM